MRVDSGVISGDVIGGAFDSMLAKLIVTGADRLQALERSRRALGEFVVEGMPTVLPFHRAVVGDPAFATDDETPFNVHTRWIETEWDNTVEPFDPATAAQSPDGRRARARRRRGRRQAARGRPACWPWRSGAAGSVAAQATGPRLRGVRRPARPVARPAVTH